MIKDVLISIKGLQFETGNDEPVEMIASGEYYFRNKKHYVLFEEISEEKEGQGQICKNTLKFSDEQVELTKKGSSNVHMIFQEGEKSLTYYGTPFGQLMISIFTNKLRVTHKEDVIEIKLEYDLEINQSYVSDCEITILVISKDSKGCGII